MSQHYFMLCHLSHHLQQGPVYTPAMENVFPFKLPYFFGLNALVFFQPGEQFLPCFNHNWFIRPIRPHIWLIPNMRYFHQGCQLKQER